MKKRYLIPALIILSIVSLFIGVSSISIVDLLDFESEETQIFLISRLPRLVAILLAGAGMSMAGLIMQQLSRNKFVSPTTAGTLDATRLGILVSMLLFANASMLEKMTLAFAFALPARSSLCKFSTASNSKMRFSFRLSG
jgi:iron complex transport system permease protein